MKDRLLALRYKNTKNEPTRLIDADGQQTSEGSSWTSQRDGVFSSLHENTPCFCPQTFKLWPDCCTAFSPSFLSLGVSFLFLKFVISRIFSDKLEEQSLGEATGSGRKSDAVVFDHLDLDPWVFVQSTDWIRPSSKEVTTTRGIQGRRDGTVPLLHTVLWSVRNPRVP